jgi:hypothetical protein
LGLSDATFQIEQQGASPASFCVGSGSITGIGTCIAAVPTLNLASYESVQYVAQLVSGSTNNFTVTSMGTVRGAQYTLQASVQSVPTFQFGAFGVSSVTVNGNGGNIVATDENGNTTYCPTGSSNPCPAEIGSDGTVTCHGGSTYGTGQVVFGGGQNNCPVPITGTGNYHPLPPVLCPATYNNPPIPCLPQPPPTGGYTCPADASGNINVNPLEPGIYECTTSTLTFPTNETIDYTSSANLGQVQIYWFPPNSPSPSINFNGPVNQWQNQSSGIVGNPADLQIYAAGSGSINAGGNVNATLYAPGYGMTINGSAKLTWTGSFIVNQFTMNGNPTFQLNYDVREQSLLLSSWQPSGVAYVPPSSYP